MKAKDFLNKNCDIFPTYYQTTTPTNIKFVTTNTIASNINVKYVYQ